MHLWLRFAIRTKTATFLNIVPNNSLFFGLEASALVVSSSSSLISHLGHVPGNANSNYKSNP